jgi:hypothetical protein
MNKKKTVANCYELGVYVNKNTYENLCSIKEYTSFSMANLLKVALNEYCENHNHLINIER